MKTKLPIGPVGIDYGYLLNPPSFISAAGTILRQRQGVIHIQVRPKLLTITHSLDRNSPTDIVEALLDLASFRTSGRFPVMINPV